MSNSKSENIIIENDNSVLRILDHNILHILYAENTVLEINDVDDVFNAFHTLPNPKPLKVISEFGVYASFSTGARNYASKVTPDLHQTAYVVKGLAQRLLLNFYIKLLKRKKRSAKVFNNFDAAYQWIKSTD